MRQIVAAAGADMERFAADFEAGIGREAVLGDYNTYRGAVEEALASPVS